MVNEFSTKYVTIASTTVVKVEPPFRIQRNNFLKHYPESQRLSRHRTAFIPVASRLEQLDYEVPLALYPRFDGPPEIMVH
ncbi:hypothetical protein CEXT_689471 [Caerostris extrusa]|uniref:Uncharacterized protein n=1 Tax=Caerostris extrusa TaxID=172846 RepID=A0AAV4RTC9_CAEEX|nr:hypothetical protein CEXT_689471 [Caerostris extrusa]